MACAERRLVFDEQQMFLRVRHLARRQYFDTVRRRVGQVTGRSLTPAGYSASSPTVTIDSR